MKTTKSRMLGIDAKKKNTSPVVVENPNRQGKGAPYASSSHAADT